MHDLLAPEFAAELQDLGHIYMKRLRPLYPMKAYPISAYPARCQQAAAIQLMITNNLDPASREEVLGALRSYSGAVVLVSHDEGAVSALEPERVLLLPDGVEDLYGRDYQDLIELA